MTERRRKHGRGEPRAHHYDQEDLKDPRLAIEGSHHASEARGERVDPRQARESHETPCQARVGQVTPRPTRNDKDESSKEERTDYEHSLSRTRSMKDRESTHHGSMDQLEAKYQRSYSHRVP